MKADASEALRLAIAMRVAAGDHPVAIARGLGCSQRLVFKVRGLLLDPEVSLLDGRRANPGGPRKYPQAVRDAILALRNRHPSWGPLRLESELTRHAERYQLAAGDIPGATTITELIHDAGLANKPIGPRSSRPFPDEYPHEPGTFTLDGWGPWRLKATRLYLCTVADRYTRMTLAVPAVGGYQREGGPDGPPLGSRARAGGRQAPS